MFITGIFSLFFRFILLCMGVGAANGVSRGDMHAAVILLLAMGRCGTGAGYWTTSLNTGGGTNR
jgi:hypothetical protein